MSERWLIFTDMDGTLLNHHDYHFEATLPLMQSLDEQDIPVIFNTSKTLAEMQQLAQQFNNRHPFIVENGSAVVIPTGYFPDHLINQLDHEVITLDAYRVVVIGKSFDDIQKFVTRLNPEAVNFSRCSVEQAMSITGLSNREARAAQQRDFSVPLQFENKQAQQEFIRQAAESGFSTLRGGRFVHILGQCDKGSSMLVLKSLFEDRYEQDFHILALGDSPNDLHMLTHADKAVIVSSPSSHLLQPNHPALYLTQQPAPEGWVEGVKRVLPRHEDSHAQ